MLLDEAGDEEPRRDFEELTRGLDQLWEEYLGLIDRYYTGQQRMGELLSRGYFSLAQANFNNSSRTRYGPDYYDERMQALRTVVLRPEQDDVKVMVSQRAPAEAREARPVPGREGFESGSDSVDGGTQKDAKTDDAKIVDPIRWFGILVPSALRTAQKAFIQAVEEPVPQLVELARQMRIKEVEISRLRKRIVKAQKT